MRILFVGNRNLKHRGQRCYDPGIKVFNGLIRNGHNVFWLSDRDEARSSNILRTKSFGKKHCNNYFLDVCKNFKPEMIIFYHADMIRSDSVEKAREILPNIKIAQFNVDIIFNPHTIGNVKSKLPFIDASFHTTAGDALKRFSGYGAVISYMPNPVDSSVDYPKCHENSNQENDVFWAMRVGKRNFENDKRLQYPLFLEETGKVKIDYHGINGKPSLFNAEYYERISNCKMGLNISSNKTLDDSEAAKPEELYLYSSDRIAQYMGSGLLTFNSRENGLENLFEEDKEMVFFNSKEELLDKILHYKENDAERKKIAKAGWEKSHLYLNEKLVAKYIVETTFGKEHSEDYIWPTEKF